MTIQSYFATQIYYTDLVKKQAKNFNAGLADECYRIQRIDTKGHQWCKKNYPGGYTSYGSISNLHERSTSFIELEKKIRNHVITFADSLDMDLSGKKIYMTDCWVNIMPHRVIHPLHLHPLSFISGTYYVQTPPGCSTIKFEDPRMSKFMAAPPRKSKASKKNLPFVEYKAQAGKVVLFESWLRHEVAANPTKEDRISVSFNYAWD